jgi:hypothetical protein
MLFPQTETSCISFGNYPKSPTAGSGYFSLSLEPEKVFYKQQIAAKITIDVFIMHVFSEIFAFLFPNRVPVCYTVVGGMAEWTIAAVLKV